MLSLPLLAEEKPKGDGYRGIWYAIRGAYSGGMATYPQHQMPMAEYAAQVDTTYFVYGGEPAGKTKNLQMMIGAYNHKTGMLANPTLLRDCVKFGDAHANPCMAIDPKGHIYIYAAARHKFSGMIFRSDKPYDISSFTTVAEGYIPYTQAWINEDGKHFLKFTKYKVKIARFSRPQAKTALRGTSRSQNKLPNKVIT